MHQCSQALGTQANVPHATKFARVQSQLQDASKVAKHQAPQLEHVKFCYTSTKPKKKKETIRNT